MSFETPLRGSSGRGETIHALPLLRLTRYAGEGFAPDRRRLLDPATARLPGLRRALHDLRARAASRPHRRQTLGPARAVRPREDHALAGNRAALAPRRGRARRAH